MATIIPSLPQHLQPLYNNLLQNPPYGFFPSSAQLVRRILRYAQIQAGLEILEPSAGSGVLARAARAYGAIVDVIELDPRLQTLLIQQGFNLVGSNLMTATPTKLYPRIIANPPFSQSENLRGTDINHIQRMYQYFLAPGGRLVSVVSNSMNKRYCPRAEAFQHFLDRIPANVYDLPLEIFWETERPVTVEAYLIVAEKPS
ncbi:MAG: class I SAM-dependent methyltransferase [Leptolyngbyaceae cyanobacterium bins.302]|nr:class I SAM-dependent methyltransferase [Leptolyngbyaceae cyanobacterium bins.302]